MTIVAIEDLASYLKRDLDEAEAFTAQLLLDGAIAAVVEYCGWHIAPVITETVTVDGTGTSIQTLPTLNLVSLDTVNENGLDRDVTRIDWSANGVMEKRSGDTWTARRRGIVAGITHGYPSTPSWVTTLICAAAGRAYLTASGSDERAGPIVQESAGGESVTYAAPRVSALPTAPAGCVTLLAFEKKMLDRIAVPLAA